MAASCHPSAQLIARPLLLLYHRRALGDYVAERSCVGSSRRGRSELSLYVGFGGASAVVPFFSSA